MHSLIYWKKCEMFVNVSDEKLEVIFFSVPWFFKFMQLLVQTTKILIFFKKKNDNMFVCLVVRINTISLVIFPVTIIQVRNVRKQLSWYPEDKFSRSSGRNSQTVRPATTQKETKVRDKIH